MRGGGTEAKSEPISKLSDFIGNASCSARAWKNKTECWLKKLN